MNRFLIVVSFLITFLCPILLRAQLKFHFSDGIDNPVFKTQVESNVCKLLTEINRASAQNEPLDFSEIQIEKNAAERLRCLWHYMSFSCEWCQNVQPCLRDFTEYEIRNIPILVKPVVYKGKK